MIFPMAVDTIDVLGRVPLFSGLERRDLERLAKSFRERRFPEGGVITEEGQPGVGFFVIVEGSANVSVSGEQKGTLGAGDSFGEMALLDEGPRSATVVAATDLRCVALSAWEFRPFIEEHPNVAWVLLQTLARRLRAAHG
jgi:CRP/FNR family transcriptional regulator